MQPLHSRSAERLALLAWIVPAAGIAIQAGFALRSTGGAQAHVVATAVLSVGWFVLACTPLWRRTLSNVSAALLERLGVLTWLGIAWIAVAFASGPSATFFACLAGSALLFAAAAWFELRQRDAARAKARLLIVGIWIASFVVLDVVIARFVLPKRSHDKIFTQHDPVLGWRLRADFSLERREADYTGRETTNSLGFRTPEIALDAAPGVRRIVILGDSHSEGYTVGDDETLARLLERDLGPNLEVISLGVGGYSTDQELLSYVEVGRRFRPDLVVLQFCSNDIAFNVADHYWRGNKPRFVRYGELLMLRGVPVPDSKSSGLVPDVLSEHSALFAFLEGQLRQVAIRRAVEEETDIDEAWHVTELLIRDLRRAVEGDGGRLVCFDVNVNESKTDQALRTILARHDVPYLDITPAYAQDFDGLWVSGHWNATGQRRVADVLGPMLRTALDDLPARAAAGPR